MAEWTIDTQILYKASECFAKETSDFSAVHLLMELTYGIHRIVVDNHNKILSQYERCLQRTNCQFLKNWIQKVRSSKCLVYYSGGLPERHRITLLRRLNFDSSDMPFVAVAFQSLDKLLVSEDLDYTVEIRGYLERNLGIQILSTEEALEKAKS